MWLPEDIPLNQIVSTLYLFDILIDKVWFFNFVLDSIGDTYIFALVKCYS